MNPEWIKMFQDLQADKQYQKEINRIIDQEFNKIKDEFIDEFMNHPITQEIQGGISATNISGTLGGITNLYSFIGFDEGTDPIRPIEELLKKSNYRIIYNNKSVDATVTSPVVFNEPVNFTLAILSILN